jgi:hypothetical protein
LDKKDRKGSAKAGKSMTLQEKAMEADKKSDYSSKMIKELTALIDGLRFDDEMPKQFLKSRWLDQLIWMDIASKKNQNYYYILRLSCIVGGVLIPVLVSIDANGALLHFLTVLLGLVVAVSAAVEAFFHFGERWRHYRRMAEILKSEGWSFFQRSGKYREYESHAEAYPEFAGRVEEIFQKEVEVFITKVSKEKADKKKSPKP